MNFLTLVCREFKAVFSNSHVLLTAFGGVILYSFLYPLPYGGQVVRGQEVAVVNHDLSLVSRKLERMVDATPDVNIAARCQSLDQAKALFFSGAVKGILVIPEHFHRDLLLGKSPTLAYAGDASYFLVYGAIAQGIAKAQGTLGAQVKVMNLVKEGESLALAQARYAPVRLNPKPCFNPAMGYIPYVVPGVFVLILHQTLIMAAGILTSGQTHGSAPLCGTAYWESVPFLKLMGARTLVFSTVYLFLFLYYFGWSFEYHGVPRLADPLALLAFLTPFLISATFMGYLAGILIPYREYLFGLVLVSSMPLVFSAGFIWPLENLPDPVRLMSQFFPSTPGIQGFLAMNQMGASFPEVAGLWRHLWLLCLGWGLACICAEIFRRMRPARSGPVKS